MASILLTGGAGYVGSICAERLLEYGHRVIVVDDLSTGYADLVPEGAEFAQMKISDIAGLRSLIRKHEVSAVFHFAAKALVPESITDPAIFYKANVSDSLCLLEAMRLEGVKKIVFSSSAAVYGNVLTSPIVETVHKAPVNAYGETKLALENALQWYARAYGWSVFAFRYFNACGASAQRGEKHQPETHIIPLLFETANGSRAHFKIYGRDYDTPDGTCIRDYVHVIDIAEAHVAALDADARPEFRAYNIGTGQSYSVLQVIHAAERVTGRSIAVVDAPRRPGDPAVLCADATKLMRELSWTPSHSDLSTILKSAWNWHLRQSGDPAAPEIKAQGAPSQDHGLNATR